MAGGGMAWGIAALAVIGAGALGAYGWETRGKLAAGDRAVADERAKGETLTTNLASCTKALDEEKGKREGTEKLAAETAANLNASKAEIDALRDQRAETDKRMAAFKAMTDKFRKMIDSGKLDVSVRHGRMVVKMPAGVLFPSGSADLSKDGQAALGDVAAILKQFPDRRFEIAGHTDNVPTAPSGPFKDNWQLSTARAVTVTEQLVLAGMNPARLSAAGYSEYEPVRDNVSDSTRQENRRIEIVLMPNLEELPPLPGDAAPSKPAPVALTAPSAKPSASPSAKAAK